MIQRLSNMSSIIICNALFSKDGVTDLHDLGIEQEVGYDDLEPSPFRFHKSEISNYNEGSDKRIVVLRLKNGDAFRIDCSLEEVDTFMRDNEPFI